MSDEKKQIEEITSQEYKYGFVTDIDQESAPPAWTKTSSASSRARKTSRHGCWNGG